MANYDPHLASQIRNPRVSPCPKKSTQPSKTEEEIDNFARILSDLDCQNNPPDSHLMEPQAFKLKKFEEHKQALMNPEQGLSLSNAVKIIVDEGTMYLGPKSISLLIELEKSRALLLKANPNFPKDFRSLCEYTEDSLRSIDLIALKKFQQKEFKGAEDLWIFLTVLCPDVFVFWVRLGLCYMAENEYLKAIAPLKASLNSNPNYLSTHLFLAECYLEIQDQTELQSKLELIDSQDASLFDEGQKHYLKEIKSKSLSSKKV